jgi:DNA (cytosine-5)-methyltransferase 1
LEGARLQFFPDWYDFGDRARGAYLRLIGNAVPPKMAYVLGLELLR